MDFPLDPPDAPAASGGGDFARFRQRYDGYHAGEDWRLGSSSFGRPVYSIAHGRVTYAQPLGWGADQGVVIVEHTFRDRRRVLSFYGHLDPPSVILRAGQCVARGDQIGAVGDPRTRPHLHFEIRVHLPDTPGPGYWPVDPRLAGWRPPSATIWLARTEALPGVAWTWLGDSGPLEVLGVYGDDVLATVNSGLVALDLSEGTRSWSHALPGNAQTLALDQGAAQLYVQRAGGLIEAYKIEDLSDAGREEAALPAWSLPLGDHGRYDLVPLPQGGVLASTRGQTVALSAQGSVLWRGEGMASVLDWAHSEGAAVIAGSDGVWVVDARGADRWSARVRGERVVASAQPYVYANDGVYRLDMGSKAVVPFLDLPEGFARLGDLTDLPGGGVLVAHRDLGDIRLISIAADGSLRWERSIRALEARSADLAIVDNQAVLIIQVELGNSTGVQAYAVGLEDGELLQIFASGSRLNTSGPVAWLVMQDQLLIGIQGVGFAAWSPRQATEAVLQRR